MPDFRLRTFPTTMITRRAKCQTLTGSTLGAVQLFSSSGHARRFEVAVTHSVSAMCLVSLAASKIEEIDPVW